MTIRTRHPANDDNRILLANDHRLKLLLPADNEARDPSLRHYFAGRDEAQAFLDVDHSALLDALWKLRSAESMFVELARRTSCSRTASLLKGLAADYVADAITDVSVLLARKAEAELYLLPQNARLP